MGNFQKKIQKIFNRNFRNDGEIKQKGIYIINVDVFKHPNEIMQFITDLKCTESNSICEYTTYSFTLVIILNIT